jgi:hypothetical protein
MARYTLRGRPLVSAGRGARRQGLHIGGVQRVAGDRPVAGGDLLDDAPGDRTHVLALDLHHRVGEPANDLLLLVGGEDILDDLHIDQGHRVISLVSAGTSRLVAWGLVSQPRGVSKPVTAVTFTVTVGAGWNGVMELEWQHEPLQWELNEAFVQARDGRYFKRDFQFFVDGKHVWGWVGVLDRGSRAKAGFSILHSGRVVKGWPDSWRPEAIYGQVQGSNDLVNQRLTGEVNLDAFEVTHTKDNIQWMGSEEDDVQEALRKECSEYRELARSRRREPRPVTDLEVQTALQELEAELNSDEFIDLLATEPVPPPEVVAADTQALVNGLDLTDPQFSSSVSLLPDRTLQIAGYLAFETSVNDPYVISEATSPSRVIVVINMNHPHVQQVSGSDGLLNYFRHCTYDAIAEWQARNRASTTDPDTIKLIKDRLLRLPMSIQMHEART